jgi:magnesium-transporting ATPase (P-type)
MKVNDLIEKNLELIGSTAIEDKLQDGVSKLNKIKLDYR